MQFNEINLQNFARFCNEVMILALIDKGFKHGYQLSQEIEKISDSLFSLKYGTMYPILHKLEANGFIQGEWEEGGTKRKRKYYSVTESGRERLAILKDDFKLFFSKLSDIVE
jgi:PadR family transcriptional regulator PadR